MTTIMIDRAVVEQALNDIDTVTNALSEALNAPQPYVMQAAMMSNDKMQIDPVSGNVSINAPQPEPEPTVKKHLPIQPEPVAWITDNGKGILWWERSVDKDGNPNPDDIPLYAAPPRREWVSLTDAEIENLQIVCIDPVDANGWGFLNRERFARAIEAALKERNHES